MFVTNNGTSSTADVVLTETVDPAEQILSDYRLVGNTDLENYCAWNNTTTATCDVGTLEPGETVQFGFQINIAGSGTGEVNHAASATDGTVSASENDSIPVHDASTSDLRLTEADAHADTPGLDEITWGLFDDGPSHAVDVTVQIAVPADVTVTELNVDNGTCDLATKLCTITPGAMAAYISLWATAPQNESVTMSAEASTTATDPDLSNNTDVVQITTCCPPASSGGGGGASVPNLEVTLTAASNTVRSGTEDDFEATVTNRGGAGALQTHLVITLPWTMTLVGPPSYDSGSGCTGTTIIDCFLDYVPNLGSTTVRFGIKVIGSGQQSLSAMVSSDREADPSDNATTAWIQVVGLAPPSLTAVRNVPAPALRRVGARTLSGVRRAASETVDTRLTVNEPLKLGLSVTPLASGRKLAILKGTKLGSTTLAKGGTSEQVSVRHAGTIVLHLVFRRGALVRGRTYVAHVTATNANDVASGLNIRFRA